MGWDGLSRQLEHGCLDGDVRVKKGEGLTPFLGDLGTFGRDVGCLEDFEKELEMVLAL